ncbi:MAG: SRPBCC family protein [Candidatus Neomarinimicrobiota bacterium]|nr:SRPBCC family protein [Candidatus Neomarinimicrobiota bacterium]
MKVKISKTFSIRAPVSDVWGLMTDVKKVSSCIPGAQYDQDMGDNKHSVMMVVKVGPIKSSYRGEVSIRSMDQENHIIEIDGKGTDTKGKGGATMELVGSITDKGDGTSEVKGDSTITIQGMLAQFGSRMIEDVSNQLFLEFTASLAKVLEGDGKSLDGDNKVADALSGVAVASAAIKGVSGRLMDKLKSKKE